MARTSWDAVAPRWFTRCRFGVLLRAATVVVSLAACAHAYVDEDGNTHVTGLVHVVVPKSADARQVRAESIRVKSFGLSVLANAQRTSVTLGYSDDTMVLVRDNACVAIASSEREFSFRPATTANDAAKGIDQP